MSGIIIETSLVALLSVLPEIERKIGKSLNFDEGNTIMICQAVIVAYVVKTCKFI